MDLPLGSNDDDLNHTLIVAPLVAPCNPTLPSWAYATELASKYKHPVPNLEPVDENIVGLDNDPSYTGSPVA